MQLLKRTVGLYLADDIIDHLKQILLPLLHEHTNLTVGKRLVQQRCSKSDIGLYVVGRLRYLRYHHVGLALGYEYRDFLVLLMDNDGGMRQVFGSLAKPCVEKLV